MSKILRISRKSKPVIYLPFQFKFEYSTVYDSRKEMPMIHPQQKKLAELLVHHSTQLKPGEKCLIQSHDIPEEMLEALIEEVYRAGAYPFIDARDRKSSPGPA